MKRIVSTKDGNIQKRFTDHIFDPNTRKEFNNKKISTYIIKNFNFKTNTDYILEDGNHYIFENCHNISDIKSENCDLAFLNCTFAEAFSIVAMNNKVLVNNNAFIDGAEERKATICAKEIKFNNVLLRGKIFIATSELEAKKFKIISVESKVEMFFNTFALSKSQIILLNNGNNMDDTCNLTINGRDMKLYDSLISIKNPDSESIIKLDDSLEVVNHSEIFNRGGVLSIKSPNIIIDASKIYSKTDEYSQFLDGKINHNGLICSKIINSTRKNEELLKIKKREKKPVHL